MTLEGWSILQVDDAHTHAVQVSREGSANKIDSTRVGDRANSDFTFELDTHRCRSLYRLPAAPVFRSERRIFLPGLGSRHGDGLHRKQLGANRCKLHPRTSGTS